MEELKIEETEMTPLILFKNSACLIEGNSLPEDARLFYLAPIEWLKYRQDKLEEELTITIRLNYLNSSSSKQLLKMFYMLEDIMKTGNKVLVKWVSSANDSLMIDKGEGYKGMIEIPFEIILENN